MSEIPYLPNIISALASGAVGAGLSRTMTRRLPSEDDDQYQKRLSLNTGIGALGGAATGAALPTIVGSLRGSEPSNNPLNWIMSGGGAAADTVVDAAGPLPVAGGLAGGYLGGQKAEAKHDAATAALQSKADASRSTYNAAIKDPALRATTGADLAAAEAAVSASHGAANKAKWRGRGVGGLWGMTGGAIADGLLSRYIQ